ncbi:hypothetical protein [Pseudomonas sp. W2Jun17]|uniref:hypothetical protein n=1 Tax=Pseudomonas sp. W2Jun17 TaxID=1553460 RepID=UPI002003139C|nr:hypothetical protein [Pseudomonas sp. W2Jun17]MCK3850623.1 hypothetical protein [Pseudomonas sp. W2Jun17]
MTTRLLAELTKQFHETEHEETTLELPIAIQVACNVLQTALAILQKEGPNGSISMSLPRGWAQMQELAEDYSTRMGLKVSPLNYSDITVNRYPATALRYAYNQLLNNPNKRTIH